MRRAVPIVLAVLALAAVPAPPAASADEPPAPTCVPTCTVIGFGNAFAPRTTIVQDGATVTWTTPALDSTGHTANDASYCFYASWSPSRSGKATFHVVDGQLYAQGEASSLRPCPDAVAAGDGVFLLPYFCAFHPLMDGELVVVAA